VGSISAFLCGGPVRVGQNSAAYADATERKLYANDT